MNESKEDRATLLLGAGIVLALILGIFLLLAATNKPDTHPVTDDEDNIVSNYPW